MTRTPFRITFSDGQTTEALTRRDAVEKAAERLLAFCTEDQTVAVATCDSEDDAAYLEVVGHVQDRGLFATITRAVPSL